jgi:prepilin-type N-terminal cleavage/methylation domain-containing protein
VETELGRQGRDGSGFTLVEVLIVVVILGVLMTTLAAVFTVVARTTPPTDARADDARSLQGLVTWLPQDIDAAPAESGFNADPDFAFPCGGTPPAEYRNVLTMTWTEKASSTVTYVAAYLYERTPGEDGWRVVRYFCSDDGSGASAASRINLTSDLPAWDDADPPVWVVGCRVAVDFGSAECPAGDEITGSEWDTEPVRSLKLTLTLPDGSETMIDAAPKNPDQNLADDPDASTNLKPTVTSETVYVSMDPNTTVPFDIAALFGVNDPETGTNWTVAVDTSEIQPVGLTASVDVSAPQTLSVTAAPGLAPATLSPLHLIVSDDYYKWEDIQLVVTINDPANQVPTVSTSAITANVMPGEMREFDVLDATDAADADGDPLQVIVLTPVITGVKVDPSAGEPGSIQIEVPGGTGAGDYGPFDLQITDGEAVVAVTLTVKVGIINVPLSSSTSTYTVSAQAGTSTPVDIVSAFGVNNADGDPLTISATPPVAPSDVTASAALGVVTIDIAGGSTVGPKGSVTVLVDDGRGSTLTLTIAVTVLATTPPASDCVLGTLSASPTPVDRSGGGSTAHFLKNTVTVTLTYTGTCDGLLLYYGEAGDSTPLGSVGRVFPAGSPTSITIVGNGVGGVEKFVAGSKTLTVTTTSAVSPNSTTATLVVSP